MQSPASLALFAFQAAAGILFLATTFHVFYQCFLSPLAKVPGPFLAKFSNLYRAYITWRGQLHRDIVSLHEKYGKVVRIGPNNLSVADPMAFREIYKAGNKFTKDISYNVMQGTRPFDLAGERNEKIHSAQRKLVARAYSMESMIHLEPKVDSVIQLMLGKLDERLGETVDLGFWLQLFAFDVTGAVSFTRPFGFVDAGDDQGLFLKIQRSMISMAWLMQASWIHRIHEKLKPIIGNWLAANDRNGYFFNYASKEVVGRKDRGGDDRDILGQLFAVQKEKSQLSDVDIAFMMTSNVFAGSDTTSGALRGLFYFLFKNPDKLNRLLEELKEKKANGQLSDLVSSEQAKSCGYLQAVLYESMRLLPPVAIVLDRDVPQGGMSIGPYYIPEGVVVGSSAWAIHRMPEVWGPDANEFRPERWLNKYSEGDLKRFFFAFGGGSRTCIGRNISWLGMEKVVPTILMRYAFHVADDLELKEESGALVFFSGLNVRMGLQ
ncbi:cytochrome P450 [Biscogniauxia marginata]|nr:cytochrome P450 [Biscogniauxia marginata]